MDKQSPIFAKMGIESRYSKLDSSLSSRNNQVNPEKFKDDDLPKSELENENDSELLEKATLGSQRDIQTPHAFSQAQTADMPSSLGIKKTKTLNKRRDSIKFRHQESFPNLGVRESTDPPQQILRHDKSIGKFNSSAQGRSILLKRDVNRKQSPELRVPNVPSPVMETPELRPRSPTTIADRSFKKETIHLVPEQVTERQEPRFAESEEAEKRREYIRKVTNIHNRYMGYSKGKSGGSRRRANKGSLFKDIIDYLKLMFIM